MQRLALFAICAALAGLVFGGPSASAAPLNHDAKSVTEISAQARTDRVRPRPRTRIYVYPRYPYRTWHSLYPLPYPIEYPGPNTARHCVSNLVQEHRPSGTVVVPRTRCWWARR